MAVVIIGGSGRGAGKTAVGCALIQAIPELRWIAVKVSPHGHLHSLDSRVIWEERDASSQKDTGRYLAGGAQKAFLVSGPVLDLAAAVQDMQMEEADSVLLVESNQSGSLPHDLCLAVLGEDLICAPEDWKKSLRDFMRAADALVLTGGLLLDQLPEDLGSKKLFILPLGTWTSANLIAFVRESLIPYMPFAEPKR